jgi:hypothetical protein
MGASSLLAGAWWRDGRGRWYATVGLLVLLVVSSMFVAGVFKGIDVAMEDRIQGLYTQDHRITKSMEGVARPEHWRDDEYNQTLAYLSKDGAQVTPRFESQLLISRRDFVDAVLNEDHQYTVGIHDGQDDADQIAIGLLVGLPQGAPTWDELGKYLLPGGRMPDPNATTMELVIGLDRLEAMVPKAEREGMRHWPPTPEDLRALGFTVTAGVVAPNGIFAHDVIRPPARVVGVYDTHIDLVDSFTVWTTQASAASLSAEGPYTANAFTVRGSVPTNGYITQSPTQFTARFVGALLLVVQVLAQISVGLLLAAPLFLVWNNLQQILDRARRELVVCRALGIRKPIPIALGLLAGRATMWGLLGAAAVVIAMQAILPSVLSNWSALPVPATFRVDVVAAMVLTGLVLGGTLLAIAAAWRAHVRQDLASTLRAS